MFTVMGNCKLAVSLLLILAGYAIETHCRPYYSSNKNNDSDICPKGDDPRLCPHGSYNFTEDESMCLPVPYCYRGLNESCRTGHGHSMLCRDGLTCNPSCQECQNCDPNGCDLCPKYKNRPIFMGKRLIRLMQTRRQMAYAPRGPKTMEYQPPVVPLNEWDYQPMNDEQLYQM